MVQGLRQLCATLLTSRGRHEEGPFGELGRDFWPLTDDYGGVSGTALLLQRCRID
jgi:hypothetical protein